MGGGRGVSGGRGIIERVKGLSRSGGISGWISESGSTFCRGSRGLRGSGLYKDWLFLPLVPDCFIWDLEAALLSFL